MDLSITNLTLEPRHLSEFGVPIAAGATKTFSVPASALSGMRWLADGVLAGIYSYTITPTAAEVSSGILTAAQSVAPDDLAPVDAAVPTGVPFVIRKAFTALAAGTADDVVVIAANALPRKLRIFGGHALVSTAIAATTLQARDEAAGAGQLAASFGSAATGLQSWTGPNATVLLTPGSTKGLFIRRSDRGVAGELFLLARWEN